MSDDLNEKTVLLNEIHHRVKNNFQIIISLIELQVVRYPENKEVFVDLINRIKSMSLTYEDLLLADNKQFICFGEYLNELIDNVKSSCHSDIEFIVHEEKKLLLNLEVATSAGIAINELIMNSCKHGFNKKKRKPKLIEVMLFENGDDIEIHVNDNGDGIKKEYLHNDSKTLGLNLVKMLIKEQLEGSFYIKNDHGTKAFIKFRK